MKTLNLFKEPSSHPQTLLWKFCFAVMLAFGTAISLFLAYYSAAYSYYATSERSPLTLAKDSLFGNLTAFCLIVGVIFLMEAFLKSFGEYQRLAGYVFLGACCIAFFIAGYIWVSQLPYYPSGDQINTTAAAYYNLNGNFSMFEKSGYIGIYAQQKGLVFLYEIIFTLFGDFCYDVVAVLHVLSGVITMIFGYLFLENTSERFIYRIAYCFCILFCAPYIILMPYAYGDIPSICFCTILFWALRRYSLTLQKRYVLLSCIAATLALFVRMNSWIVLIAVAISLFLFALERRSIGPVLVAACILLSAALSVKILNISYEIRSGYEDTKGTPATLFIAMGMQEGLTGPGTYNRFNQSSMELADFDRTVASAIGKAEIKERLSYFCEYPHVGIRFFRTKVEQQWLEPLFETLISTYSFPDDAVMPEWIYNIYHDANDNILIRFADFYQSIVYIAFAAFVLGLLFHQRDSVMLIPLIAIIGGFLFSIIWEAQCRYVLPYYLFMMVYVPIGLCNIYDCIAWIVRTRILKKADTGKDSQDKEHIAAA